MGERKKGRKAGKPRKKATYQAKDIDFVGALEHVRMRPAMYVGDLGTDGLHELITIVLDELMDEALAGHCTRIAFTLGKDGSVTTEDDGHGISVAIDTKREGTTLEVIFTHIGACFCGCTGSPGHRQSRFGMGIAVVNALSESLAVETTTEGQRYRLRFSRGQKLGELEHLGPTNVMGTTITFMPDRSIFAPDAQVNRERLLEKLHGLAALAPGVTLGLTDRRPLVPFSAAHRLPRGLVDFLCGLTEQPRLATAMYAEASERWREDKADVVVRVAIQIDEARRERVIGFANYSRTDAGSHVDGVLEGLELGVRDVARELGLKTPTARPSGVRAVVAIKLPHPEFDAPTRTRLLNPRARDLASATARRAIAEWANHHRDEARALLR